MYDCFKNLIDLNYNLNEVVQMTSYNCAKHFNLEKIGSIEKDYFADLIVLDKQMEINTVLVNGKTKYSK